MRSPDPPDLAGVLQRAAKSGPLTFDTFMDIVLYEPRLGYYARSADRAGRSGDFLTSPEVTPLFAACVAEWLETTWSSLGRPDLFHVVEGGAGRGTLANGILDAVQGPFAEALRFHLVERGAAPRAALASRFAGRLSVKVYETSDALPTRLTSGAFLANELFDNLPVRRVMRAGSWKEIVVAVHGSKLREELVEAPPDLVVLAEAHGLDLEDGQSAEVSPGAVPLLTSVVRRFQTGGLLLFDYGGEADEVSGQAAPQGTLAAHRGHARHHDLYGQLGEKDITAHVNFTPLRKAAESEGYGPMRLESQARFLLAHGLAERFVARMDREADPMERLRLTQLAKQLYHPEAMGESFRVLHGLKRATGQRH